MTQSAKLLLNRWFHRSLMLFTISLLSLSPLANADELFDTRLKKYITGEAKHSSKFGDQGIDYLNNRENINHAINAFIFDTYIAPDRLHLVNQYNATLGAIEAEKNEILDGIEDFLGTIDGLIDVITLATESINRGNPPSDLIYLVSARLTTTVIEVNVPHKLPSSKELAVDAILVCVNNLAEAPASFTSETEALPFIEECILEIFSVAVEDSVGSFLTKYLSKESAESYGAFSGDMIEIIADCTLAPNKQERALCAWAGISQGVVWGSQIVFNILATMDIKDREFDLITKLAVYELLESSVKFGLGGRNQITRSYLGMPLTDGLPSFFGPSLAKANEVFGNPAVAVYAQNTQLHIGSGTIFSALTFEEYFNNVFLSVSKNFNSIKSNLAQLPPTLPEVRNASGTFSLGDTILLTASSYAYSATQVHYDWYKVGDSSPFFSESPPIGTPSRVRVKPSDYRSRYKVVAKTANGAAVTGHKTVVALPEMPTLLSPSNGSEIASNQNLILSFASAEGAQSYSAQVFDRTKRSWEFVARAIPADTCSNDSCEIVTHGLQEQSSAGWRVIALNENNEGNWTAAAFFDVKPLPPPLPVILSPQRDNTVAAGERLDLRFSASLGAQNYSIQVFDRNIGAWTFVARNVSADQHCTDNECVVTVAGLSEQSLAGWRVSASNEIGSNGWTIAAYFDVESVAPEKPTLLSPSSGDQLATSHEMTLKFKPSVGAQNYSVQVFDQTQRSWIFVARRILPTDHCSSNVCEVTVPGLPAQKNAAWRVTASSETGSSDWTTAAFFDVNAKAPTPLSPVSNQNLLSSAPIKLSFTAIPGVTRYHVKVFDKTIQRYGYSNAWVTDEACSNNICQIQIPGLAAQEKTTWQVRSYDHSGWSNWSVSGIFSISEKPASVAVGTNATCVIKERGYVSCMGAGSNATKVPVDLINPRAVSIGVNHACALDDTGVRCWGLNIFGVLDVPPLQNPIAITSGDYHTCAIDQTGPVCWGRTYPFDWNQITGLPYLSHLTSFESIDSASNRTCILAGGDIECLGQTPPTGSVPVPQPNLIQPTMVNIAYDTACALDFFGIECWGNALWGHTNIPTLDNPTMVTAGYTHACALDATGVVCWGRNLVRQIEVPELINPIYVKSRHNHTCAVDDTGVVCWGQYNHRFAP